MWSKKNGNIKLKRVAIERLKTVVRGIEKGVEKPFTKADGRFKKGGKAKEE